MSENKADIRVVKRYSKLLGEKIALEEKTKALAAQLADLHHPVLNYFQRQGVSSLAVEGRTLYIRSEIHTSKTKDVTTEQACDTLHARGLGEYTGARVNTQGLAAYVRELHDQGQELKEIEEMLDGAFRIVEVWKIGSRKK